MQVSREAGLSADHRQITRPRKLLPQPTLRAFHTRLTFMTDSRRKDLKEAGRPRLAAGLPGRGTWLGPVCQLPGVHSGCLSPRPQIQHPWPGPSSGSTSARCLETALSRVLRDPKGAFGHSQTQAFGGGCPKPPHAHCQPRCGGHAALRLGVTFAHDERRRGAPTGPAYTRAIYCSLNRAEARWGPRGGGGVGAGAAPCLFPICGQSRPSPSVWYNVVLGEHLGPEWLDSDD